MDPNTQPSATPFDILSSDPAGTAEIPGIFPTPTQRDGLYSAAGMLSSGLGNEPDEGLLAINWQNSGFDFQSIAPLTLEIGDLSDIPLDMTASSAITPTVEQDALTNGGLAFGNSLIVPGQPDETVQLSFQWTGRDASFDNEVGLFLVENGEINEISPDDPRYAIAALTDPSQQVVFASGQTVGASQTLSFKGGDQLGFYLIQNSTTASWLNQNSGNDLDAQPIAFFSTDEANPDALDHIVFQSLADGSLQFGWEDLPGDSDRDFNDVVFKVSEVFSNGPADGILEKTPGNAGQSIDTHFFWTGRSASFDNELGLFLVDDENGRIGNLNPQDAGYTQAALTEARRRVIFESGQTTGAVTDLSLPGDTYFGWYLIQNASTQEFLSENPGNQPNSGPLAFFSLPGTNPDQFAHLQRQGDRSYGWEDIFGGGDQDFNDLVFRYQFKAPTDAVSQLSIGDAAVVEGASPTVRLNVNLSEPASTAVTVEYTVADGSATSGEDYVAKTGTLNFAPGQTEQQVEISIIDDNFVEAREQFSVDLSQATNADILDAQGIVTITDDDTAATPVNDPPVLSLPDAQTVKKGSSLQIDGIFVEDEDADDGDLRVRLSVESGIISLIQVEGLRFLEGQSSGSSLLTFVGTLPDINNALATLTYLSGTSLVDNDVIEISVNDLGNTGSGGALSDSGSIDIVVLADNTAPTTDKDKLVTVEEDTDFTPLNISVPEDADGDSLLIRVSTLPDSTKGAITLPDGTAITLGQILSEAELGALGFSTFPDGNGSAGDFTYTVDDGKLGSASQTITLEISPVNDAPILTVPTNQTAGANTLSPIRGVSIRDIDAAGEAIEMTLSVTDGSLSLSQTSGLVFASGNGTNTPNLSFSGTVAAVNAALNTLSYQSETGFTGSETLRIAVNDLGNSGAGGALRDEAVVTIEVTGTPAADNTVSGTVFIDDNGNAELDATEVGQSGVTVFLDLNRNGVLGAGEPSQITDSNGQYRFENAPEGDYLVWQNVPIGFEPSTPESLFTAVNLQSGTALENVNFGNQPFIFPSGTGEIRGFKWEDINANGVRDTELVQGSDPDVVFVVDVSGSADFDFVGSDIADFNGDGIPNTRLDAEIAGFIALNEQLVAQGLGNSADVGIVVFSGFAAQADMNTIADGVQLVANPLADADGNGISDVEDILRSLESGAFGVGNGTGTNFENALREVEETFTTIGTSVGNGNVVFLSDGEVNRGRSVADEVERLSALGVNLSAFGVGSDASLSDLQNIDPDARIFTTADELLNAFSDLDSGAGEFVEPSLEGFTIYLDLNGNAQLDRNEPTQVTDAQGNYVFTGLAAGSYDVREVQQSGFGQTFPFRELVNIEGLPEPVSVASAQQVTLAAGEVVEGVNFGNKKDTGEIRGIQWEDADADGVFDDDESPLTGATVYLDLNNNGQINLNEPTQQTDSEGRYRFRDLNAGNYTVREITPLDFQQTFPADRDSYDVELGVGEIVEGIDFGSQRLIRTGSNRPPEFTSTPVVEGIEESEYSYQPIVNDPENDPLTFTLVNGPEGLTIESETGLLQWVPTTEQIGDTPVTIQVSDDEGLTDTQTFTIAINPRQSNTDPIFVSEPLTEFANASLGGATGSVSPTQLALQLEDGEIFTDTVSITAGEQIPLVDVLLLLDDTGSFADAGPLLIEQFPKIITTLETRFPNVDFGFGLARYEDYAEVGSGEDNTTKYVYALNSPIVSTKQPSFGIAFAEALERNIPDPIFGVNDTPEALIEGLFQVATGAGFDGNDNSNTTDNGAAGSRLAQELDAFATPNEVPNFDSYDPFPIDEVRDFSESAVFQVSGDENSTVDRTGTPLEFGDTVSGSIGAVGEENIFTFSLPERTLVYVDEIEFSPSTTPELYLESNLFLPNNFLFDNISISDGNIFDLPAGDYNIVSTSTFSLSTGDYAFRILTLDDAVEIDFDLPISGTFAPIEEADIFQFEAEEGDVIFLDIDGEFNPLRTATQWRHLNPSLDRTQFGTFDTFGVEELFRIDESGTQTLLLEGLFTFDSIDSIDYEFEIKKIPNAAFEAAGNLGGAGFRPGALPIVLATADTETVYQPDDTDLITGVNGIELPLSSFIDDAAGRQTTPGGRGASVQPTIDALNDLGALVIGLGADVNLPSIDLVTSGADPTQAPRRTLEGISTLTGAVNTSDNSIDSGIEGDPIEPGDPLYFLVSQDSGERIAEGIAAGVEAALTATSFDIDLSASSQDVGFQNLTGVVGGIAPGEQAEFSLELTGNGSAQEFELLFTRPGTGIILGSIPVSINNGYFYAAQAVDVDGDTLDYSLVTAPTGATIDAENGRVQWTPFGTGVFDFTLLVEDGRGGEDTQTFSLAIKDAAEGNTDPVVTSSPVVTARTGDAFGYQVIAEDADGDALNYYLTTAPEGMLIEPDTGSISWTPTEDQLGAQEVVVRVIDARGATTSQSFTIDVAQNQLPVFSSEPNRIGNPNEAYTYDVEATDPEGTDITYSLRQDAPEGMTIDPDTGLIQWLPTDEQVGRLPITVFATDAEGERSQQSFLLSIGTSGSGGGGGTTDSEVPVISFGFDSNRVNVGETFSLQVRATDDEDLASLSVEIDGDELVLSPAALVNGQLYTTTTQLDQPGVYPVTIRATDNDGNETVETFDVGVFDPADTESPEISFSFGEIPVGLVINEPFDILGKVSDPNLVSYRVEYAPTSLVNFDNVAEDNPAFVLLNESNVPTDGVLATLDPRFLNNDQYFVRVVAEDLTGISVQGFQIGVSTENKVGNFTLDATDLSVPLTGVPISVQRRYDTLQASSSASFGHGWEFAGLDARITESAPSDEEEFFTTKGFRFGDRVTLTTPDGDRVGFTFEPTARAGLLGAIWTPQFTPDAGVEEVLTVETTNLSQKSDGTFGYYLFPFGYNPSEYELTTKNNLTYTYDQFDGLQTVEDLNGNVLTYSEDGIASSTGETVRFERDSEDRITQIIDPAGNDIRYQYDANGDLVGVTDRGGNTTQYEYDPNRPHYLTEEIDPLGRSSVRTEFDDFGRVNRIIDAEGNALEIDLNFDGPTDTQTISDALGLKTTLIYDDRGNVLQQIDPEGGVTRYEYDDDNRVKVLTDARGFKSFFSYDERDNLLTETNALDETTTYTYNELNQVETITDARGFVSTNRYDDLGNLKEREDAEGNIAKYDYYADGTLRTVVDAENNTTGYVYDEAGRVEELEDATGAITAFDYDNGGNLKNITTPLGNTTSFAYDAEGRLVRVVDAKGNETKIQYNAVGERTAVIDALGRRTSYTYNKRSLLERTLYPDGTSVINVYDANDQQIVIVDRAGRTTQFVYDGLGRLVSTLYPDSTPGDNSDNPRVRREYDTTGNLTAFVDENGNRTEYEYDAAGQQTLIRDALNNETAYAYDPLGNLITVTDALNRQTKYDYDRVSQLVKTTFADNTATQTVYDKLGRIANEIDQNEIETKFSYDELDQLTQVEDALGSKTTYGYDDEGNLISQKDALNRVTQYEYDELNQRIKTELPLGQTETYVYDAVGNLKSVTDFNQQTISYDYDSNDLLEKESFEDGSSVIYDYTSNLQLETVTDIRGVTKYEYDERDRLIAQTNPDNTFLNYEYDVVGNRISLITPSGQVAYAYDPLNRIETVKGRSGGTTTYSYDSVGNLFETQLPNGVVETRGYNTVNNLRILDQRNADGLIASYQYTLGKTGRRTRVEELNGRSVEYSYDDLYRLTEEAIADLVNGNRTISYTYDDVGNRLKRDDSDEGVTTYLYDNNNRLNSFEVNETTTTYSYDDNGNTLTKTDNQGITVYTWDQQNRLIQVETPSGEIVIYQYDIDGNRVSEKNNESEIRFLVDSEESFSQLIEEYKKDGSVEATYLFGNSLISQVRADEQKFQHGDAQNSIQVVTNELGDISDRITYDSFGRLLSQTGSSDITHQYTGEQFDGETELSYLRARYYDVSTGRFISQDSFEGFRRIPESLNRYSYVYNDPVNRTDPSGNGPAIEYRPILLTPVVSLSFLNFSIELTLIDLLGAAGAGSFGLGILLNNILNNVEDNPNSDIDNSPSKNSNDQSNSQGESGSGEPTAPNGNGGGNSSDIPNQGTVPGNIPGAPPVDAGKQGKHVKGHNNHNPDKSTWTNGVDSVAETQEAWVKGVPIPGRPGVRQHDAGRPVGTKGETGVRVHGDKSGNIHGHPVEL